MCIPRNIRITILLGLALLLITALYAFTTTTALADEPLACGAVLTAEGSPYTLTGDINDCDDDNGPALTVMDGVTLNLNGYWIRCRDNDSDGLRPDGIVVAGSGATVRNGGLRESTVNGCRSGIVVLGDDNTFSRISTRDNREDGWAILGSGNQFNFNTATGNGKDINECPVPPNVARAGSGFRVYSDAQEHYGDYPSSGADNSFRGSVSDGNACDGLLIDGDDNTIRGSYANGNGRYGIHLHLGAGGNLVEFNNAWGNPRADMSDENEGCGTNAWRFNFFSVGDRACVR